MAPQQIQSLEILMAAIPELEQKISQELIDNPTLERLDNGSEQLMGNPVEGENSQYQEIGEFHENSNGPAETLNNLLKLDQLWHDRIPTNGATRQPFTQDDEERRQFFFDSLVDEPSVQEILLEQLREVEALDDTNERLCREIIGSIDDAGYLRTHLADIATACHTVDLKKVEQALQVVQSFDPPGIGARDLRECLLLQLQRNGQGKNSIAYKVVDKHLEDIGRNRLLQTAKALHVSIGELKNAMDQLRRLHPFPGTLLAPEDRASFVAPEAFVERDDKEQWQVRSNKEYIPRLRISPYYLKLLQDPGTTDEVKTYIRSKIGNSKLLMRALEQRESTIVRIARSLLTHQIGFFEEGVEHMKPLTMSQVATEIDVHETTVSRAIANKYVMTPHGLFPFRHFFTTGYENDTGEMFSSLSVKQKLREAIDTEPGGKPHSDQKLTEMLKRQGFNVARRTVAKYREELGILPSNMRKKF